MTTQNRSPAYHWLYVLLRDRIRSGQYAPGAMLASEHALAQEHDVSRVTVRRALDLLVDEKLVVKKKGKGTFVARPRAQKPPPRLTGIVANLVAEGGAFEAETIFQGDAPAPAHVRERLDLAGDQPCRLVRRVRFHQGAPLSHAAIYLPPAVSAAIDIDAAPTQLIIELLDRTPFAPDYTEHVLTAVLADGEIAELLKTPPGAPLLRMRGVVYSKSGAPVYFQESHYHPDRYEYAVRLNRDASSSKIAWRDA